MRGALVLAGGKSRRFGSDKAIAKLKGKPLVTHVVKTARHVAGEIVVAIGRESSIDAYEELIPAPVRIVKDLSRVKSPMVGMLTGFKVMQSEYSVVLTCDTPFVNENVLRLLFRRAVGYDAAVPKWSNCNIEPLQSVYRIESAIPTIKRALRRQQYRNVGLIECLNNVNYVPVQEIRSIDKGLATFFNINRPSDLRRAEALSAPANKPRTGKKKESVSPVRIRRS